MAIEFSTKQDKKELITLIIADAEIKCLAPSADIMQTAKINMQKEFQKVLKAQKEKLELGVKVYNDLNDVNYLAGFSSSLFVLELTKIVVKEWTGIIIDDKEAEVTKENIEVVFANFTMQEQFMQKYEEPLQIVKSEKK